MDIRFETDVKLMDFAAIHGFLSECYWCKGISFEVVEKAAINSLSFGLMQGATQIGFGRFVTDKATFAYLADVFVLDAYQGQGLGEMMMAKAMALPEIQDLRRLLLATRDAHGLYQKFGFETVEEPALFMQLWNPNIYD